LDRFYLSRIGIRILIGQHVALGSHVHRPDYVGIICTRTNMAAIGTQGTGASRRKGAGPLTKGVAPCACIYT
jgi:pyruvate dehydrogenase kinase 2/3/4